MSITINRCYEMINYLVRLENKTPTNEQLLQNVVAKMKTFNDIEIETYFKLKNNINPIVISLITENKPLLQQPQLQHPQLQSHQPFPQQQFSPTNVVENFTSKLIEQNMIVVKSSDSNDYYIIILKHYIGKGKSKILFNCNLTKIKNENIVLTNETFSFNGKLAHDLIYNKKNNGSNLDLVVSIEIVEDDEVFKRECDISSNASKLNVAPQIILINDLEVISHKNVKQVLKNKIAANKTLLNKSNLFNNTPKKFGIIVSEKLELTYFQKCKSNVMKKNKKTNDICKKICNLNNILLENGILHNDLHHNNIMFNSKNEMKIIDFGLSQMIGKSALNIDLLKTLYILIVNHFDFIKEFIDIINFNRECINILYSRRTTPPSYDIFMKYYNEILPIFIMSETTCANKILSLIESNKEAFDKIKRFFIITNRDTEESHFIRFNQFLPYLLYGCEYK